MDTPRRVLDVAVGASVTVFLLSCGEATEPLESIDRRDDSRSQAPAGAKADSFEDLEHLERDGDCGWFGREDDPDCQLRIASWNIQHFSSNKAEDEAVMESIAETVEYFDLVAVQEVNNIREMHDVGCPRNEECPDDDKCGLLRATLDAHLNDDEEDNYGFAFSPQVRHERYLYIYDKDRVELLDHKLVDDPGDSEPVCAWRPEDTGRMVRQPHLGVFRADDFTFALLNAHVAPLAAGDEIEALLDFEAEVRREGYSDVIILGDLNADCRYLNQRQRDELADSAYHWLFRGADTTVAEDVDCAYDQMIVTEPTLEDLTGDLGVAQPIDEEVSDHYPIWANFYLTRDTDDHESDGFF